VRIGFFSGDLFEFDEGRASVSVPDYPVQGHLLRKLVQRGHEVVLLTRVPSGTEVPTTFTYDPSGDPREHDLDVLFGDRLGFIGSEWVSTAWQIERYNGPIVFHQYVPYTGWAPPFVKDTWLLGVERSWTIVNRADDPRGAYQAMVGRNERVPEGNAVTFAQWEPFLMVEHPWKGRTDPRIPSNGRPYRQGYYGRLPKGERRSQTVVRYLSQEHWPTVVYGPETSTAWVSERSHAVDGGRILHHDLPDALETLDFIVQVQVDRLAYRGGLGYRTHRIVECALAGVFQLFDRSMGIPELREWEIAGPLQLGGTLLVVGDVTAEVARQREVVLPRADPTKVMDGLEEILVGATR